MDSRLALSLRMLWRLMTDDRAPLCVACRGLVKCIVFEKLVRLYRGTASGDRQPLVVVAGQPGGSDLRGLSLACGPPRLDSYNAPISSRFFFVMGLLFFFVGAESASLVMFIRIRGQWRHEATDGRTPVIRSNFVTALIRTVISWYICLVVLIHFNGFVGVHCL